MDFANRNAHHSRPESRPAAAPAAQPAPRVTSTEDVSPKSGLKQRLKKDWLKIGALIVLIGGTILFVASIVSLNFGTAATSDEAKFVNKKEMQAVFVNVNGTTGGQVYFGNITGLNDEYIHLTNVYYIQNQASTDQNKTANQSYNLVKLGCELHGPQDQMVINRSQVFFWENLKNDSQVSKKAAEFAKANPNGQNCSEQQQQQQTGATQQSGTTTGPAAAAANTQTSAPAAVTPTTTTGR